MAAQIVGLLLAAGRGTRFDPSGQTLKLLAPAPLGPHAGAEVAVAAARQLRSAVPRVLAVVRPPAAPAQQRLHDLLAAAGCELVINPHADQGIGTSIAAGVAASARAGGWLVALADMPSIDTATVASVRAALDGGATSAAPWHRGQRGHPVGFAAPLRDALLALQGDTGARAVLQSHPPQRIDVDDPGCLLDLDTPADFAQPG